MARRPRRQPNLPTYCEFDCSVFQQGEHQLIVFHANGKQLWNLLQINRREEDKEKGYQRALSTSRATKIASFIDQRNMMPTAIIVSLDHATLQQDNKTLRIPNRPDAGWVIDGQHRLGGAHKSQRDIVFPVVAFIGLDVQEQVRQFVVVNREQKGVPSSLYIDLLRDLPPGKTERELTQERAADLGTLLKRDDESPFFGRIVATTSPKKGEISLTNFARRIAPLIKRDGRLNTFNDEERKTIIDNYYRALAQVFPGEYKKTNSIFFMTLGFGALTAALPTVLDFTINRSQGGFRVEDVIQTFQRISHFDFSDWHQRGTGVQAENVAAADFREELIESIPPGEPGPVRLK